MDNGQRSIVNGQRSMVNGEWGMVNDLAECAHCMDTSPKAPLQGRLPLGYGVYPFQGIYASHHADGLKAQGVHSPGQGERSEATPWVVIHRMVRPIRGKS